MAVDPTVGIPDFWQYFSTMGVGGALAGFAMWMLNKAWRDHTDTIKGYHETEKGRTDMLVGVINENTKQTTMNTSVLNSLHRRLDKDAQERG